MTEMTSRRRFERMFQHREADRIPIVDGPWWTTNRRWRSEGLPEDADWRDYFGVDRVETIRVETTPMYEKKVIEETDDYRIHTNAWGTVLKTLKQSNATSEPLEHRIVDRDTWAEAKRRITPSRDRIDWARLKEVYPKWRGQGAWIQGLGWWSFDVIHARAVGTERMLIALAEDPEWAVDMLRHVLDVNLALLDQVWDAGYTFDALHWPDDLGYKHNQFMSPAMYRELIRPLHQRAADWAHAHGIVAHLHSCGDVMPLVGDFVEIGIDALNPLEVKAGMDPVALKAEFGDRLVLHGGINAVLWDDPDAITAEMRRLVPRLKEGGGYIFSSDHSIPDAVSLEDFRRIVALAKKLGSY